MLRHKWVFAGQGWEGIESQIQLTGWEHPRRVIILRRQVPNELVALAEKENDKQLELQFIQVKDKTEIYEYGVMVTTLKDEIYTIAQHYRDRADSENNFDELKNQWGWCGFTTKDISRSQTMARIISLVYNWWVLFVRLIIPKKHTEALTSRPLLLHAVGKQTQHANSKTLVITSAHAGSEKVNGRLTRISRFFKYLNLNAEQLPSCDKWVQILSLAFVKYLKGRILKPPNLLLNFV